MKPYNGLTIGLLFIVALCGMAKAQNSSFQAHVNKTTITMNETLTLQLSLSGGPKSMGRPSLPPLKGFRTSFAGQSQNYSFINGQASSEVTYSYILVPQAPGNYTIPALSLTMQGQTLTTQPISIKVVSGSKAPSPSRPSAKQPSSSRSSSNTPQRNLFVTTAIDKKKPHVGEALTLTFRFYHRVYRIGQLSYAPPETTGFLSEDLPPERRLAETINGLAYSIVELKTALFPTSPGKFTIGPAALQVQIRNLSRRFDFDSIFDDFFSSGKAVTLRSDPIQMTVLPLPKENRPKHFNGDVGHYQISASIDKTSVQVHEPLTLTVTISGKGNIKAIAEPPLPPMEGFKSYETLSSLNISKTGYRVHGSKVFKTVLKPEVSGSLTIPSLSFSFFDPRTRSYITKETSPIQVHVSPSDTPEGSPASAPVITPEGVKIIGKDIRFIKEAAPPKPFQMPFHKSLFFLWMNLIPGLSFLTIWSSKTIHARAHADPVGMAFRRARVKAEKNLRTAKHHLQKEDFAAYYAHAHKIFLEYLGDKTAAPAHGLTWDKVQEQLNKTNASKDLIRDTQYLWENFDMVRFTPSLLNKEEAQKHMQAMKVFLKDLESVWKK